MHELSIAQSIVEMVDDASERTGGARIAVINLRLGALASVVEDALQFSFELVAAGTAAEGARLAVENVPIAIYCRRCEAEQILTTPTFCCPACGTPTSEILRGRELEVASMELADG